MFITLNLLRRKTNTHTHTHRHLRWVSTFSAPSDKIAILFWQEKWTRRRCANRQGMPWNPECTNAISRWLTYLINDRHLRINDLLRLLVSPSDDGKWQRERVSSRANGEPDWEEQERLARFTVSTRVSEELWIYVPLEPLSKSSLSSVRSSIQTRLRTPPRPFNDNQRCWLVNKSHLFHSFIFAFSVGLSLWEYLLRISWSAELKNGIPFINVEHGE